MSDLDIEGIKAMLALYRQPHIVRSEAASQLGATETADAMARQAVLLQMPAALAALLAEVERLRAWIVEADSAFSLDGSPSKWEDGCLGLVRMCHEGRAALNNETALRAENAALREQLTLTDDKVLAALNEYEGVRWDKPYPQNPVFIAIRAALLAAGMTEEEKQ